MDADLLALRIKVLGGKAGAGEVKALNSEVAKTGPMSKQAATMTKAAARGTASDWKYAAATMVSTGRTMTYGLTLPLAAVGVLAVKTAVDFTKSMAQVQVATNLPSSRMASMRDLALEMGAKTIFSANESAEAMLALAKSGISPAKIEAGALASTMQLAATESLALGRTAEIVGAAMNTFKIPANESARIADALAGGANASSASVGGLAMSLSQGGQSAAMYGLSLEETVGTLAAFAQNGIQASDAGTSFKTFMMRLNPTQKKQKELMNELNLSFFNQRGELVGITEVAGRLQHALGGMTDEQRNAALQTLFGSDAQRAANIVYREGPAGIERYVRATKKKGAAERMANAQMEGLPGAIERLKGSLETAALVLGEAMAPAITAVASHLEGLANRFTALPDSVQTTVAAVGGLVALAGPLLLFVGSVIKAVIALRELGVTGTRAGAGAAGLAALVAGQAVGGRGGEAIGNIGGGAAMGFAAGGPMGAVIGGGLGAALTFGPAIAALFSSDPKISKMRKDTEALTASLSSYGRAGKELVAVERRADRIKHRHSAALHEETRATNRVLEVLARYGPNSRQATHAQLRLAEAQARVTRTAKAEQHMHELSGFRLKAYRLKMKMVVGEIKALLPEQKRRIGAMREEVNHGRATVGFLNKLERLEKRVGGEKRKLTMIYGEAERKGTRPFAESLRKLNPMQATAAVKTNELKGRVDELKESLTSAPKGPKSFGFINQLRIELRQATAQLEHFMEVANSGVGGGLGKHRAGNNFGHNAAGTNFWGGGPTWLAERGPELVDLPRGAKVTPAPATKRLLAPVRDPERSAAAAAFAARGGGETRYLVAQPIKIGKKVVAEQVVEAEEDAKARL